ncbi:MAG: hypothetical protein LBO78_02050 [Rickettsiales bacterium]|jgi:hypothetical protein|nr:hypothetical protein [Rickettsiales bacterium]
MKKYEFIAKRLKEKGSNQRKMALATGIDYIAINKTIMPSGPWQREWQLKEIKPVADYLGYDLASFLEYINGKISHDEIKNADPAAGDVDADLIIKIIETTDRLLKKQKKAVDMELKRIIVSKAYRKIKKTGYKEETIEDVLQDAQTYKPELFKVA